LPDFNQQFIVEMMHQMWDLENEKPISFLSKPLSQSNKFLSIYEKSS
jgi:hypothetical protein